MAYEDTVEEIEERERKIYEELAASQEEFEPSPIRIERPTIPPKPPIGPPLGPIEIDKKYLSDDNIAYITNEPESKAEWEKAGKKVMYIPPEPKKSDLAAMKSLPEMQQFYIENYMNGKDPRTNDYFAEASRAIWGNYSVSEQAVMDAKQKQALNAQVTTLAEQMKNKDMTHFTSATLEMFKHERNHQEALAKEARAQAEKLSETARLELKAIETDMNALKQKISSKDKQYQAAKLMKEEDRKKNPLAMDVLSEHDELTRQYDEKKAKRDELIQTLGGKKESTVKTQDSGIMVGGKLYKQGQTVVVDGKRYIVRKR